MVSDGQRKLLRSFQTKMTFRALKHKQKVQIGLCSFHLLFSLACNTPFSALDHNTWGVSYHNTSIALHSCKSVVHSKTVLKFKFWVWFLKIALQGLYGSHYWLKLGGRWIKLKINLKVVLQCTVNTLPKKPPKKQKKKPPTNKIEWAINFL